MNFTQPVSMICSVEQYNCDLREPLLAMGYKERNISDINSYSLIVNNHLGSDGVLSNVIHSNKSDYNRYYIDTYNPDLFLALAGMTDSETGNMGEWWKLIGDSSDTFTKGKLYKQIKPSIEHEFAFLNDEYDVDGYHPNNTKHFVKPTKEEIINYFTNNLNHTIIVEKITVKKSDFKLLHDAACSDWNDKLTKIIAKDFLYSDTIEFTSEFVNEMRNACTKEQRVIFDTIFKDFPTISTNAKYNGKDWFGLDTANSHITPRTNGEYAGKAFYLTSKLNWELKRDSLGSLVLIPTKKS